MKNASESEKTEGIEEFEFHHDPKNLKRVYYVDLNKESFSHAVVNMGNILRSLIDINAQQERVYEYDYSEAVTFAIEDVEAHPVDAYIDVLWVNIAVHWIKQGGFSKQSNDDLASYFVVKSGDNLFFKTISEDHTFGVVTGVLFAKEIVSEVKAKTQNHTSDIHSIAG